MTVESLQNQNSELKRRTEICQEENKLLEKANRQKVIEVEKLSQTIRKLEESILAGGAVANVARDYQRHISELNEEKKTLERELARAKVSVNRVATVAVNEWKDEGDKVIPLKQWIEEKKFMQEKGEFIDGKVDWKGRPARKGVHGGFSSSVLILALFGFDIFANTALAVTLVTYVNSVMHFDIASASTILTNLLGTSYLAAVFISYLAGTFIGRYKVVLISAVIEFLGLALLTVQAHTPSLKPPACNPYDPTSICVKVEGGNYAFMYVALYLTAIGMAGAKAGVPSHGADQFDEKDPAEALSMSSFFNWFLLSVVVGATFSVTLLVWIQQKAG